MVSKLIMFHENTELLPSGESHDLSLGNKAKQARHNGIYSLNCVRINFSSGNITVLGSYQVFDKRILLRFIFRRYIPF